MLALLLAAQIAADTIPGAAAPIPSDALRALVARAAAANAAVPAALGAYDARAMSEIGVLLRRADGTEVVAQVEQVASDVRWTRGGALEQRIVGLRSLSMGFNLSMLSFFRDPWVVPVLYGNRLLLPVVPDSVGRGKRRREAAAYGIHPFAADRDAVYRFSGGDTVAVLRFSGRSVPIARIHVEPFAAPAARTILFRGDVDIDAESGAVVRMRGNMIPVDPRPGRLRRLQDAALEAAAFIELENAEVGGRYWLPAYQRVEMQASATLSAGSRSVVRLITRFRDYALADRGPADGPAWDTTSLGRLATADSAPAPWTTRTLTMAPADTLSRFGAWTTELGAETAETASEDFDDVGPDSWRPAGRPRLELRPSSFSEVFRFDRIEGAYTGLGAALRFRDAAPGLTLRGNAGWAWSERTVRGGLALHWLHGRWQTEARAERALANTNDFRPPLDNGFATFSALLYTLDNYDYVDRRLATIGVGRELPGARRNVLRLEAGLGRDAALATLRRRGMWVADSVFRPNRGVDEGRYVRTAVSLDLNPSVTGDFLQPGAGARLRYERGDGDLDWQRVDLRLLARRNLSALVFSGRLDAGLLASGEPPPQQLFELGLESGLPGYDYKAFAGDRAALLRGELLYRTPVLRAPMRVRLPFLRGSPLILPGASPSLVAGVQSGWTRISSAATRRAVARLGYRRDGSGAVLLDDSGAPIPLSTGTDGVRTTIDIALRLFGGIDVGVARAVDRRAEWRFVWGI